MWSSIETKFKDFEKKAADIPEDNQNHISANPNAADDMSDFSDSASTTSNNTNTTNNSSRKKKRHSNAQASAKYSLFDTTLQDLQPLVCGPWPALLTTNWDAMLEQVRIDNTTKLSS